MRAYTFEQFAKEHGVSVKKIDAELPNYYTRIEKMKESEVEKICRLAGLNEMDEQGGGVDQKKLVNGLKKIRGHLIAGQTESALTIVNMILRSLKSQS